MHIMPTIPANGLTPTDEPILRAWAALHGRAVERDQTDQGEVFFALPPRVLPPLTGCVEDDLSDLHLARHDGRVVALSRVREITSGRTVADVLAALSPVLAELEADLAA